MSKSSHERWRGSFSTIKLPSFPLQLQPNSAAILRPPERPNPSLQATAAEKAAMTDTTGYRCGKSSSANPPHIATAPKPVLPAHRLNVLLMYQLLLQGRAG